LLAGLGNNGESHFAVLQMKYLVCGISLRVHDLHLRKDHSIPAHADGVKECLGIELAAVLGGNRVAFCVRCDFWSIGAGTASFVEPSDL